MTQIHPSAVIDPAATIGSNVSIGPFCVVGPDVTLHDGVILHAHVCISGRTTIDTGTQIFPFASIGYQPQDLKYHGEPSVLTIGAHNTIREHVTINPGTEGGGMITKVGNHCLFMVGAHIAHDCQVGDHVILANNATLAGHVTVGDGAIIGGLAAIHQFVRIGRHAIIGGMSGVEKDVIPYGSVIGERANLAGLNLVGLKRRNVDREAIHALRGAYRELFESHEGILAERIRVVRDMYAHTEVQEMLDFLESNTDRSFCTPKSQAA